MSPEERADYVAGVLDRIGIPDPEQGIHKLVKTQIEGAVAEEREAIAKLADELGALYDVYDYDDPEAKAKGGAAVSINEFSAVVRARAM